jgi:hypothetical protein
MLTSSKPSKVMPQFVKFKIMLDINLTKKWENNKFACNSDTSNSNILDTMSWSRWVPIFQRNILLSSSRSEAGGSMFLQTATRLHGVITRKATCIFTIIKTSNFTSKSSTIVLWWGELHPVFPIRYGVGYATNPLLAHSKAVVTLSWFSKFNTDIFNFPFCNMKIHFYERTSSLHCYWFKLPLQYADNVQVFEECYTYVKHTAATHKLSISRRSPLLDRT